MAARFTCAYYEPVDLPAAEIDWKARALDAERKANEAWHAYHQLAAQQADAQAQVMTLEQYEESISWKITAPLRLAKRMAILLTRWLRLSNR